MVDDNEIEVWRQGSVGMVVRVHLWSHLHWGLGALGTTLGIRDFDLGIMMIHTDMDSFLKLQHVLYTLLS